LWLKDIAPSTLLRKWFSHYEKKWDEFKSRYFKELEKYSESVNKVLANEKFNNAVISKKFLEQKIKNM
jgi:uncharacterized protein YeaO (DUF488 family)